MAPKKTGIAPTASGAPVVPASKVYVVRITTVAEATLSGAAYDLVFSGDFYPLTQNLRLEDRLFLQVWDGAPTGKARLVKVIEIRMPPTTPKTVHAPTVTLRVQQTWGWGAGAEPVPALAGLSWKPEPDVFPVFEGKAVEVMIPVVVGEAVVGPVCPSTKVDTVEALTALLGK